MYWSASAWPGARAYLGGTVGPGGLWEGCSYLCVCYRLSCPWEGGPSEEDFILDDVTQAATRWLIVTPRVFQRCRPPRA